MISRSTSLVRQRCRGQLCSSTWVWPWATVYRPDALNVRIERYVAEQRKAGYYESRLTATPAAGEGARTVDLTLTVTPGAHVRVVFIGYPPRPTGERNWCRLTRRIGGRRSARGPTNRIEDDLRAQGYRDAKAPHRRDQQDGELAVTFDVTKGAEYRVGQIDVSGNASDRLRIRASPAAPYRAAICGNDA